MASLQPSFSWTPLTLSDTFTFTIPGIQPIDWKTSVDFFPTEPATIPAWQASFKMDNGPVGSYLSSICPQTWDLGSVTGKLAIQGSLGLQAGVTLTNGQSNATIDGEISASVTASPAQGPGGLELVEFQSTGEGRSFTRAEAMELMDLGLEGCATLMAAQRSALP